MSKKVKVDSGVSAKEKDKSFKYKEVEINDYVNKNDREMYLESTYNLCVQELALQQSKRDQIIAFYIAVISFAIPAIITLPIINFGKAIGFLLLYILGTMLTRVIMRYRIYKEVYWITCRTITQLYNIEKKLVNKVLVQHLFYKTLKKNAPSVIITETKKDKDGKEIKYVKKFKSYKKILNSAETILYGTLVFITSIGLCIGLFLMFNNSILGIVIAFIALVINLIYWNVYYYSRLTKIYDVVIDGRDASFNAVFGKAWFLHSFVD